MAALTSAAPTRDDAAVSDDSTGDDHPTSGSRWQYVVANVGMFGAKGRLQRALAFLGPHGYELITVYDKASNWFGGMEKGFMLFKREVPPGHEPDGPWCGLLEADAAGAVRIVEPPVPAPVYGDPW